MSKQIFGHSEAWVNFSRLSFFSSVGLVAAGIILTPVDWWMRAYLVIGMMMLIQSSINMTKTLRDQHESERLINRLDDARTEKLIHDVYGDTVEAANGAGRKAGHGNG
jgi:hypothetical protein